MDAEEIRSVVSAVLAEQQGQLEQVSAKAVAAVLVSFGIDGEDNQEMRADFAHLRKWRRSVEQAESLTFKLVLTTIVSGALGALWLGVKVALGK